MCCLCALVTDCRQITFAKLSIKRVKPKIKFYVLGVCVWQVPMKHANMLLLVIIRLMTQIQKASVIHLALNKLALESR